MKTRLAANVDGYPLPRGVLRIFVYGDVHMEGKIQTQKHGSLKILHPKILGSCISSTQNMGKNCVLVINLTVRGYFRGTTELNQAKMTVAETFYPSKLRSSCCKS